MIERQLHRFVPSQSTRQQNCQKSSIALSFQTPSVRRLPECLALFGGQPIAEADSKILDASNSPDPCRQVWTQQATISRLVGQAADRTQPKVDRTWCQFSGFQVHTISKNYCLIEGQTWL
jgi:hypothetical protein